MKLYEYAVLFTPIQTKDQLERGEKPKTVLLVPVTTCLANSDAEAQMIAARAIPETNVDKLAQCEDHPAPFLTAPPPATAGAVTARRPVRMQHELSPNNDMNSLGEYLGAKMLLSQNAGKAVYANAATVSSTM